MPSFTSLNASREREAIFQKFLIVWTQSLMYLSIMLLLIVKYFKKILKKKLIGRINREANNRTLSVWREWLPVTILSPQQSGASQEIFTKKNPADTRRHFLLKAQIQDSITMEERGDDNFHQIRLNGKFECRLVINKIAKVRLRRPFYRFEKKIKFTKN